MSSNKPAGLSRNVDVAKANNAAGGPQQPPRPMPAPSALPKRFSVLYYKRSNKVHKNRGTTREDGILTIGPPPSCACALVSGCIDDDDDDDDDDTANDGGNATNALDDDSDDDDEQDGKYGKKKTKKKKYQQMRKKRNNGTLKSKSGRIWSGTNSDMSRKAFDDANGGFGEDDTLQLSGQWECEIISVLTTNYDEGRAKMKIGGLSGGLVKTSGGMMKKGVGGLSSVRRQPPAMMGRGGGGGLGCTRMVQGRAPFGTLRNNTIRPLQSKKLGLGSGIGVKRTLGSTAAKPNTALPTATSSAGGKMKKNARGEWYLEKPESESDDVDDDEDTTSKTSKVPPSLLRNATSSSSKRPRMVSSLNHGTKQQLARSSNVGSANNNANSDFPGARGDKINVPASVRNVLRPHQKEGIAFLWNCVTGVNEGLNRAMRNSVVTASSSSSYDLFDDDESDEESSNMGTLKPRELPRGAVLADEMGLGKTLMTIATIFAYYRRTRDRRFIVVCPSSLITNWSKEFDKWLGKASQPKRIVVRNGATDDGLRNLKSFVPLKSNQSEVLILSYELFRMHVKVINQAQKIGMLVVDEGHRLKNTSGSQILTALNSMEAESRILITGTPIQNNLSEFFNVANFAVPGILGDLSTFRRLYERPMSAANSKNASSTQKQNGRAQSRALDTITSTFVLRRLQKDVLKSLLPPRMELLLFCRPTERQCELYRSIAQRASKSIGSIGGVEEGSNPLVLLTKVRKLCTHPSLLLNNGDDDASLSGKMVALADLLDSIRAHNPTDKVVIISNFTSALTVIENSILRQRGLSFVRLDGSTDNKSRGALVDSFNKGSVDHSFAFLLSSKAGGCGLNLIGANRLVMVDADWNPATDHQAMARVYRQGQTKPCFIYRMFTTGTVEEVIYQRQLQKGNLAKMANDAGSKKKGGTASFSKEELRDCFTLKEGMKCDTKRKLGNTWSDYKGVESLQDQGCVDEPLLGVCSEENTALTFVRVVPDEEPTTPSSDHEEDDDDEVSNGMSSSERSFSVGDEDESSSEEEEFDG